MEAAVVRSRGRGRKRRRKGVHNDSLDPQENPMSKKQAVETRSKALVGRYVRKEFAGSGIFLGKIVYYDTGLYRVDYEDGDCEDLEGSEVRQFIVEVCDFDDNLMARKTRLDELISSKDAKSTAITEVNLTDLAKGPEVSSLSEVSCGLHHDTDGVQVDGDADSSSDSCEYVRVHDLDSEVEAPAVPPPQLPPSSGSVGVPEGYVSHLFSVYSFLRSFSIILFLCPFGLDDFVGSLNCVVPNTLLDAIHVALVRALRRHLEVLSSDGYEPALKCLSCIDWNLLDMLTWPAYLVHYIIIMGYTNGPEWKEFYANVLDREYYTLPVSYKLLILQILCDDVLDYVELRAEIDIREESEVGIDPDAMTTVPVESGPRRVHPRYSKTSACKDQEAMQIIAATCNKKSVYESNSLGSQGTELVRDTVDADLDGNGDECRLCGMDGTLLCCDGCPSAYHSRCIGVVKMYLPEGSWFCPECTVCKIGPAGTKGTSLRAAEIFGIDSYGQVFLGTCNYLLVLKTSSNAESCLRYYNVNDIPKILQALNSSVQHTALYLGICKAILQYWEIPEIIFSLPATVETDKNLASKKDDVKFLLSLPLSDNEACIGLDTIVGKNYANSVTESNVGNVTTFFPDSSLETMTPSDITCVQQNADVTTVQVYPLLNATLPNQIKVESTASNGSVSQQADPTELTHQRLADRSSLLDFTTCTSGNSSGSNSGHVKGVSLLANMSPHCKEGNREVGGRGDRISANDCVYMGSFFKPMAYINHYIHGEFAASAAANLAVLSSQENRVSDAYALDNRRKVLSANTSLQVKAFSSAASRFFWPHLEKKIVEVPRERCGWCLSCKAPVASKRGCLLNSAALNAIKGVMNVLAGLRPMKSGEGSLFGIATYILYVEESLCGLIVGPFLNAIFRKQWRKQVEQATTWSVLKALLLELEENIRIIALSGDWVKLVDNWLVESSVVQGTACTVGSTQKSGPGGRKNRKQAAIPEFTDVKLAGFSWWRGGKPSKLIFKKGILPHSVVRKAACKGGSGKISGIYYAEGSDIPKRSWQAVWRAAVEMSQTASQLALQVRYLDLHVRWSELVRPEQSFQDAKGTETEASAFRNAFICDKKILDNKIRYGVAFGNQKHLPSRVMKNIIEVEQSKDGMDKYWFFETRIPLYLIKEYEQKAQKVPLNFDVKLPNVLSILQRKKLKASRRNIFSQLTGKRENLDKCSCVSCQLDVLQGNAVKCNVCQGYCHMDCTISSTIHTSEEVEFLITCKQCYRANVFVQDVNSNDSPTSPLPFQGRQYQNAAAVTKAARQNADGQPVAYAKTSESSGTKLVASESSLATKSRRRTCSWGLIWKKNKVDNGFEFRLKNIILRGSQDTNLSEPPVCRLCHKPYNPELMYICCETCKHWYHADAVELEESRIFDLLGFKCCRCRRIRSPVCPYMDPQYKRTEGKKRLKSSKPVSSGVDSNSACVSDLSKELEPTTPLFPVKEPVFVQEDDPLLFSISKVEQIMEPNAEADIEWDNSFAPGAQKLPVRRHVKHEKDVDGYSDGNPSCTQLSAPLETDDLMQPEEKSSPLVGWDVSADGCGDEMMFDYEGLNYEDMEFEPQTYFSFTELLASEDGERLDGVDASGDTSENWEKLPSEISQGGVVEQHELGASNDQQEPSISVEPSVSIVHCRMCSQMEPAPDLFCQICGLWIHSRCSPWVEPSSSEDSWKCGHCREWR